MKYVFLLLLIIPFATHSQPQIEVFSEKVDNTINFYARSPFYCHYTVQVQFETFENMTSSIPLPARLVVEPLAEKQFLLAVTQNPKANSWKYKVQYRFDQGNLLNTRHDNSYGYLLPYKSVRAHKLMQGYFGRFSHADTHALDFEMPPGTEIVAAREGVVIGIKEDSNIGGLTRDYIDKGNFVLIYHNDGTFGSYYHLKRNGALVKPGQHVVKGEVIGLSGNTGWSSAPHLHFEVLLPSSDGKETVPTMFKLSDGKPQHLKKANRINELKSFLDEKSDHFNQPGFITNDPISIPHRFKKLQDIEIAGLFAAVLAWGQRKTVLNKCAELLALMDNDPHSFITEHSENDLKRFIDFKHRTFNGVDTLYFIELLKSHYTKHASLESLFVVTDQNETIEQGLVHFHNSFFSLPDYPHRTKKHIATPERKSTCKRLSMYLRWMVRDDKRGVDFGLWKSIKPSQLICPFDLHVERVARELKLVIRKQTDWQTALELTTNLRKLDPHDPVKYDFALFGLGIEEGWSKGNRKI